MSRRFALVTVMLVAAGSFLVGLIVAGSLTPAPAVSNTSRPRLGLAVASRTSAGGAATLVNFADVAEHVNPAVVNIDATSRRAPADRDDADHDSGDRDADPHQFENPHRGDVDMPRRGTGSGVIIEPDGHILTNHHVIERAERIIVKLADGRTLRARVVGSDPDTDIALIKVESADPFVAAPLGDSDTLRVGEWVCAIGNPLAYEHTVTVGVVSFIGRKLFDKSLDNYIQTDAAINFGNSGGPLINARGEIIGINSAISARASNIGFAVPINQARSVLPQLKQFGRVARGYIGVALKDVDPDLQQSLSLGDARGALVQDVTEGSPGDRAGLKAYDLITAVEGRAVRSNDELIRLVASMSPGSAVRLDLLRDGRPVHVVVKLAERPGRGEPGEQAPTRPSSNPSNPNNPGTPEPPLGLLVRELDRDDVTRLELPKAVRGVVISRVEPLSPAFDADLERGQVILEVNRRPVSSVTDFRRLVAGAHAGDVLTLYLYLPDAAQRALRTVRVDAP
jgi:serine protease Do